MYIIWCGGSGNQRVDDPALLQAVESKAGGAAAAHRARAHEERKAAESTRHKHNRTDAKVRGVQHESPRSTRTTFPDHPSNLVCYR